MVRSDQTLDAIAAHVSQAVARLYVDEFGKGPVHAETSIRGDVVVTILRDVLTNAEKVLHAGGRGDNVLIARMLWQHATDRRLREAVGRAVGCPVLVAISGFQLDHDMASETFILALPGEASALTASLVARPNLAG